MTPEQLLTLHETICDQASTLTASKNRDYRGGTNDPFANFRGSAFLGIDPILGILLRCQDKFQRIRSFAATGTLAVKSESVRDAIVDVVNYMVLVAGMIEERSQKADVLPPHITKDQYEQVAAQIDAFIGSSNNRAPALPGV